MIPMSVDHLTYLRCGEDFGDIRATYGGEIAPHRTRSQSGAPRPMKMGTIASPWRYDVAADQTIRPHNLRRAAILRYASWTAVFSISRMVRLPFDCGHFDQSR
jgi:hypothetical protein